MTNRAFIDAPAGVIELEGEKEFVEAQIEKFLPLIQSFGFGVRGKTEMQQDDAADTDDSATTAKPAAPPRDRKQPKRSVNRPPKGHSCADRIMELRKDGFFKERKTTAQIAEGLGDKGWTHTASQVSAAAGPMFKRGDIQRAKQGKGFVYFWDRE